ETVFLFSRDPVASVVRPLLELKGVHKIKLRQGEAGTIRFELRAQDLSFPGGDFEPLLEPGEFLLFAGRSADPRALLSIKLHVLPN
ncbi:MAG: fibronectin type III-like domain-contianing protein, partial [Methylocapsa sp.]|nr:fibronectin type III-like domain-contianing protein [Methylocapsa sp.]